MQWKIGVAHEAGSPTIGLELSPGLQIRGSNHRRLRITGRCEEISTFYLTIMAPQSLYVYAVFLAVLPTTASAEPAGPRPTQQIPNTPVLWLEGHGASSDWEGAKLQRIIDEETGEPCLEWFRDPATKGTASVTLKGIKPGQFEAARLQWKYMGGGSGLTLQIGRRRWFLYKDSYRPDQWHDMWIDLNLDDDMGGPLLDDNGLCAVQLHFNNLPLNRSEEKTWRRIRVRNLRLVKFPIRMSCPVRDIRYERSAKMVSTTFPLLLENKTERKQPVELFLDPMRLSDFTASFETNEIVLQPHETGTVQLSFRADADKADRRPPLSIEEAPVYARVKGDPDSLTTWYRGYVQWKPGGVIVPAELLGGRAATGKRDRPWMIKPGTRKKVLHRAKSYPWANNFVKKWTAEAKRALARAVRVPEVRHGYSVSGICPTHSTRVALDSENFKKHQCPKGHVIEGNASLNRLSALRVHQQNSDACRSLGWTYYLTRDERYARKAGNILLAYAEKYPTWDYRKKEALGYWSRVTHAVLGECWWIHGMVEGYDFVADSPLLKKEERRQIEVSLFGVAAEDIQSHRIIHNQQGEINWASGTAAVNARNWYLAARAFSGAYGFNDWLRLTFSDEGFSRENDIAYHFSSVRTLVQQGLVVEALGGSFFGDFAKRCFDAPMALSLTQQFGGYTDFYEVAYSRYRDPAYLTALRAARARRPGELALLEGVVPLPQPDGEDEGALSSTTMLRAGRTVLRKGTPADYRVLDMAWGSPAHRGGKSLLEFQAWFQGVALNRRVFRIAYEFKQSGYPYHTIAGNVPEVDGLTQTGTRPKQVDFLEGEFPAARYAAPRSAPIYPGVRLSRAVAIIGDLFVIVDQLSSDKPRRYSFIFYPGADDTQLDPLSEFRPYPAFKKEGPDYWWIQSPSLAKMGGHFSLAYQAAKHRQKTGVPARAHFLQGAETEVVRGKAWMKWAPYLSPVFFVRQHARSAAFVVVLEAGKKKLPLESSQILEVNVNGKPAARYEAIALRLKTQGEDFLVIVSDVSGKKTVAGISTEENLWIGRLSRR